MKSKAGKTIVIGLPILLALVGGFLLIYELDARTLPPLLIEQATPQDETVPSADETEEPVVSCIAPEQEPMEEAPVHEASSGTPASTEVPRSALEPNTIHIRSKTYPLKWDIEESTLKNHIGWMPTSAKPGDMGVCVVMGHRNKQLRCLKDVKRGDIIRIVDAMGAVHTYTVESGRIVEDNNITFAATIRRELVLITCYPFYYSGHAPHQYLVTAVG